MLKRKRKPAKPL